MSESNLTADALRRLAEDGKLNLCDPEVSDLYIRRMGQDHYHVLEFDGPDEPWEAILTLAQVTDHIRTWFRARIQILSL